MPFEQLVPRSFTPNAVRMYAPIASGAYGISSAREWIYIGVTDDIQGALLAHLKEPESPVMKREPSGFVFEVCTEARRPDRQDCLVLEYQPVCNRQASRNSSGTSDHRKKMS